MEGCATANSASQNLFSQPFKKGAEQIKDDSIVPTAEPRIFDQGMAKISAVFGGTLSDPSL